MQFLRGARRESCSFPRVLRSCAPVPAFRLEQKKRQWRLRRNWDCRPDRRKSVSRKSAASAKTARARSERVLLLCRGEHRWLSVMTARARAERRSSPGPRRQPGRQAGCTNRTATKRQRSAASAAVGGERKRSLPSEERDNTACSCRWRRSGRAAAERPNSNVRRLEKLFDVRVVSPAADVAACNVGCMYADAAWPAERAPRERTAEDQLSLSLSPSYVRRVARN